MRQKFRKSFFVDLLINFIRRGSRFASLFFMLTFSVNADLPPPGCSLITCYQVSPDICDPYDIRLFLQEGHRAAHHFSSPHRPYTSPLGAVPAGPISPHQLLQTNFLSAQAYLSLADLSCSQTLSHMNELSSESLSSIKQAMEELLERFESDENFRKAASKISRVGVCKTKKVGKQKMWGHRKKIPALQRFARHVLRHAQQVLGEKVLEVKNFREIFEAHEYHEAQCRRPEVGRVVLLGKLFLGLYQSEMASGSVARRVVLRERLCAIVKTLQHPDMVTTKRYEAFHELSVLTGNSIQHNLHREIVDVFEGWRDHGGVLSDVVVAAGSVASACNCEHEYEAGYSLVDFARDVVLVGKRAAGVVLSGAAGVAAGAWNMATFPVWLGMGIATDFVGTTGGIVRGLGEMARLVIKGVWDVATKYGDEFSRSETGVRLRALRDHLCSMSAEEGVYEVSKLATELMFPVACSKLRIAEKFGKLSKAVGRAVESEVGLAKARLTLVDGLKQVVEVKGLVGQSKCWTVGAFEHNFIGRLDAVTGELMSGMHMESAYKRFASLVGIGVNEVSVEMLGNGVLGRRIPEKFFKSERFYRKATAYDRHGKRIVGAKTFWPGHYTPKDIIKAGEELFANPANITFQGEQIVRYKGILANGLTVKGLLNKDGKILSVFPDWIQ